MAGTDEAGDDDALYVLTAVLLTPAQFPSVLGDDYPEACAALGLEPYADGYGLVLGQDGEGARWTVAIDDVSLVAVAIASWDCGMEYDLSPDERTGRRRAARLAARGRGRGAGGARAARSRARRRRRTGHRSRRRTPRLGARAAAAGRGRDRAAVGDVARAGRRRGDVRRPPGEKPHEGVRRVLEEARGYVDSPPPLGRVRSSFAPGDARTLRADGPGWSLVARTDDIAFVLLDEEPGEVLPVGRGPELPGLLEALDKMAVRPN